MNYTMIGQCLEQVREMKPLVHNITNVVVTNFTANGLLALGVSPVMAYAPEEVYDMAKMAGALVLNIGTLTDAEVRSMLIAGRAANEHGVPIILDPVGAGATAYRTETAQMLLKELYISIVRGNPAEIANVMGETWEIKGVDAGTVTGDSAALATQAATAWGATVVATGKEDIISDGTSTYVVQNGHEMLTRVTGAGCLLSSIVGAFAAVGSEPVKASAAAVCTYGVAAEKAARIAASHGPGAFQIELLNQLYQITARDVENQGRVKQLS